MRGAQRLLLGTALAAALLGWLGIALLLTTYPGATGDSTIGFLSAMGIAYALIALLGVAAAAGSRWAPIAMAAVAIAVFTVNLISVGALFLLPGTICAAASSYLALSHGRVESKR